MQAYRGRVKVSSSLAAIAVLISACGGGSQADLAIIANAPGTLEVGTQRVLIGLVDEGGTFLADADTAVEADFYFGQESTARVTVPGVYHPTVPGVRGIYRFRVPFDEPGQWRVVLRPDGADPTPESTFQVFTVSIVPSVGDPAPRSDSLTTAEFDVTDISTDPDPDPAFYDTSVAEAVTSGGPAVIVFATPAFCTTATCGPTLDIVKATSADHPSVDYVHVEVFEDLDARSADELIPVPAVVEWGLPSEPWVFVVDSEGVIHAAFEGTVADDELRAALAEVTSGS